ncbi:YybH family protein [Pannonibacter carbonis]|uniref:YybH family protein n=1 Tax=Pannonibacter carbonis TaxID=2067569 RepID=UPI00130064BE|nr:DUF4440 domain-containing protein [Pannonibacter carbonis]
MTKDVHATITRMTDAFAKGDVAGILSTYEPDAVVVPAPGAAQSGAVATGTAELAAMFRQFVDAGVAFSYGGHEVVVAGDIALHLMQWTAPGPLGNTTALSVAVLRKQPDGTWKMVLDHPFGDTVMQQAN